MINPEPRFVSRLTRQTLALVLAGGRGSRLHELTDWRAKPEVPFGGKFRLIDFPLSNCVNSGIRRIGVLTQYKAHSLIRHLLNGWSSLQQGELGEFVDILPASQRTGSNWYAGTADAIYQNLDIIRSYQPEYVLILSGDHVYKMDYGAMLAFHAEREADMTVACLEVPVTEAAGQFGVMAVKPDWRVTQFEEKPARPAPLPDKPNQALASMGVYIFNTRFLFEQLHKDADDGASAHDFGHDIIPSVIEHNRVFAYPFRDADGQRAYWRDVGTLDAFWQANMELISVSPELNIYDRNWPILTYQEQLPPAKFVFDDEYRRGMAVDTMVSGGCIISGAKLRHSLLFSGVKINSHSYVEDSVILPDVEVGRYCRIRRAIIDQGCQIPHDTVIGENPEHDKQRGFRITDNGIVLVTAAMLEQQEKRQPRQRPLVMVDRSLAAVVSSV